MNSLFVRNIKFLLQILLISTLFWICSEPGSGKYVVVMLICTFLLFIGKNKKIPIEILICTSLPMVVYLMLGISGAVLNANLFLNTFKVIFFWIIPYWIAFSLYVYSEKGLEKIIDFQLLGSCIVFFKENPLEIIEALHFESVYAFTFGLFVLYYVYKKRWGMIAISGFFMYMSDKRITFFAVAAALIVMGGLWLFRNSKKLAILIWSVVNVCVYAYIYIINSGILKYYCQGMGINTNGRVKIYTRLVEWFQEGSFLFGKGIGVVEMLLEKWDVQAFANLHNDLLKFYVELGIVGLFVFMFSYGIVFILVEKKVGKPQMSFMVMIAIYSMILFATDNVSIYILYLLPMYSMYFEVLGTCEDSRDD